MTHTNRNTTERTTSFDQWRQNTNSLANDVGDKDTLHADLIDNNNHTLVGAINETYDKLLQETDARQAGDEYLASEILRVSRHNLIKALGMS